MWPSVNFAVHQQQCCVACCAARGEGGHTGDTSADTGNSAFLSGSQHEDPYTTGGASGGANGAAIRKVSGINFTLIGSPSIIGDQNATGVS